MSQSEDEATISLPSIAVVAVLGFILYRYFFSGSTNTSSSVSRNGLRFTARQVDDIAEMFPQLNRRDIMWDLHRNGGSSQATRERVLRGMSLQPAPPSFQPPLLNTAPQSTAPTITVKSTKPEQDLITRYNLQSRIDPKGKEREEQEQSPSTGWAGTKDARQQILQRRRDEMILAARRKMQERDGKVSSPPSAPITGVL